jgi:NUC173 domain
MGWNDLLGDREKKPNADTTPRAFLLPLLASLRSHPTPLAHFSQTFLPLIDHLTNLAVGPDSNPATAKVWSVLADQCWSILPSYCSNPPDLSTAFGRELSERLTKELYAHPALRPPILRALRNAVEAQTQAQIQGENNENVDESKNEERKKNLRYLRGQAKNWLAVLFNVFASVDRGERAQVGEVIGIWAGVAGANELAGAYQSVLGHLTTSLAGLSPNPDEPQQKQNEKEKGKEESKTKTKTALQMLDILLVLTLYFPPAQKAEVVNVVVRGGVLDTSEGAVQKVGMRLVGRLVELGGEGVLAPVGGVSGLLERLAVADSAGPGAGIKVCASPSPFSAQINSRGTCRTD